MDVVLILLITFGFELLPFMIFDSPSTLFPWRLRICKEAEKLCDSLHIRVTGRNKVWGDFIEEK